MELPPPDREAFLNGSCEGDDELHEELSALLSAHDTAGDFIEQPALVDVGLIANEDQTNGSVAVTGQRIGSYQIIRELGRGGMGSVYLAARADESFDKQVALKLIKRGMDSDAIIKRFVMERQILANLDHPNIARLIDGGTTEDGLPYFVLEYVEGMTITRYCDQHKLNTIERVKLFRQVCAAVLFAHQNLIVHRDIKPRNIIVTEDGTPKLLDFGIAKILSADRASSVEGTATIGRLLTPEYASPEELRGLSITTSSDVYSLGVVLYELLSGHRPFSFENRLPEDVARIITESQPIKPSAVITRTRDARRTDDAEQVSLTPEVISRTRDGSVDKLRRRLVGDLDNIVLKALRNEPERRYASVQEFSEDLRRHLEGLPVLARPDTLSYRTSKFITRHKVGVAAAVVVLFTLLSATVITGWQARVARRERYKAERRFNETRKLSNYLLTDVFDSLNHLSGAAQIQKELTQNALHYLDNLAQEETDDIVLLGELAAAYVRLGEVQSTTLYDTGAALQSFQKAVELQRKRISLAPDDVRIKQELVFGLFKVSEGLWARGETEKCLQVRTEILNLEQRILDAQPDGVKTVFGLAGSYHSRGEVFDGLRRREEAESDYRNALRLTARVISLSKDTTRTPQERIDLSFLYVFQGEIYAHLEDWQSAATSNRTAGEVAEAVWRRNPALLQAMRNTSSSHRKLAAALEKLGDLRGALENYQYSLRVVAEAGANNGDSAELRHKEAVCAIMVGVALRKVGETERAVEMVRRGLDLDRNNIAEDRHRAATIAYGFETFQPAAEFFVAVGQRDEAVAVYREWMQNVEKLRENAPREPELLWRSASIYANIGDIHSAFNRETNRISATNPAKLTDAHGWYQKTLVALDELRELRSVNADIQDLRSATEEKLAQCETQLKKSLRNENTQRRNDQRS